MAVERSTETPALRRAVTQALPFLQDDELALALWEAKTGSDRPLLLITDRRVWCYPGKEQLPPACRRASRADPLSVCNYPTGTTYHTMIVSYSNATELWLNKARVLEISTEGHKDLVRVMLAWIHAATTHEMPESPYCENCGSSDVVYGPVPSMLRGALGCGAAIGGFVLGCIPVIGDLLDLSVSAAAKRKPSEAAYDRYVRKLRWYCNSCGTSEGYTADDPPPIPVEDLRGASLASSPERGIPESIAERDVLNEADEQMPIGGQETAQTMTNEGEDAAFAKEDVLEPADVDDTSGIRFECPNCAQHLLAEEAHAGFSVECPSCCSALTVPETVTTTKQE